MLLVMRWVCAQLRCRSSKTSEDMERGGVCEEPLPTSRDSSAYATRPRALPWAASRQRDVVRSIPPYAFPHYTVP